MCPAATHEPEQLGQPVTGWCQSAWSWLRGEASMQQAGINTALAERTDLQKSLRKISVYKSVPSGALRNAEHWIYRDIISLCSSAHGSAHSSSQVLQPFSTLLYEGKKIPCQDALTIIPPSTPSLETCPDRLTQPRAGRSLCPAELSSSFASSWNI